MDPARGVERRPAVGAIESGDVLGVGLATIGVVRPALLVAPAAQGDVAARRLKAQPDRRVIAHQRRVDGQYGRAVDLAGGL